MKKLIIMASLLLGTIGLLAQSNVTTSGGDATGVGGTINYSIGQMAYTTHSGTGGTIAQGIQHPYEVLVISELNKAKDIHLSTKAYPNPTMNILTIQVSDIATLGHESMSYQLYNLQGKLLQSKNLVGKSTDINMGIFQSASYIIKIIINGQTIKEFKIIKE